MAEVTKGQRAPCLRVPHFRFLRTERFLDEAGVGVRLKVDALSTRRVVVVVMLRGGVTNHAPAAVGGGGRRPFIVAQTARVLVVQLDAAGADVFRYLRVYVCVCVGAYNIYAVQCTACMRVRLGKGVRVYSYAYVGVMPTIFRTFSTNVSQYICDAIYAYGVCVVIE